LKAEWIEMRKDTEERKKSVNTKGQRVMLYIHGGAYFFGSVDEHRYQMQRHARKLKARVLAPRYRLSPQFPFPCGLMDCLAAYLHLLEEKHDPSTIILAGDSAGGGMVLSLLIVLRDQGIPLPAGAILISPWVDLTHSFPSLGGDGKLDYIPAHGFVHKPSINWPPPNADDMLAFEQGSKKKERKSSARPSKEVRKEVRKEERKEEREAQKEEKAERVRGFSVRSGDQPDLTDFPNSSEANGAGKDLFVSQDGKYSIGPLSTLSVQLEDTRVEIKDQIQMYAPNHMLTHPLVSPALQPSLGGLPPLLIQVGGGELLKDEQIYIAHKAAAPLKYLPPPSNNQTAERIQMEAARHKPTNVQLQVWDDLCHVGPTLSFTRPAKHMYRSIAQFGAWALARAQKTSIDILDDDSISFVSTDSSTAAVDSDANPSPEDIKLNMPSGAQNVNFSSIAAKDEKARVGRAGDSLPPFEQHMIRQRVDRHGRIYPLPESSTHAALNLAPLEIGVPKPGPVNKWMKAQEQWNNKFSKQKLKIQKQRMKDMQKGYEGFKDESPPPTALAGRLLKGMKKEKKAKKSWGMALWSLWGSKHDEATVRISSPPTQPYKHNHH
jgi:acetyl esterase/lipase